MRTVATLTIIAVLIAVLPAVAVALTVPPQRALLQAETSFGKWCVVFRSDNGVRLFKQWSNLTASAPISLFACLR